MMTRLHHFKLLSRAGFIKLAIKNKWAPVLRSQIRVLIIGRSDILLYTKNRFNDQR